MKLFGKHFFKSSISSFQLLDKPEMEMILFRKIYLICSTYAITPFYSFKYRNQIYQKFNTILIFLFFLYPFGAVILLIVFESFVQNVYKEQSLYITELFSYLSYITISLAATVSLFFQRKLWLDFMEKIQQIRNTLKTEHQHKYIKIVLGGALLHCVVFLNVFSHAMDSENVAVTLYMYAYEFGLLYISLLLITINRIIQISYKDVDKKLKTLSEDAVENKFMSTNRDVETILKIREYFDIYVQLSNLVNDVNKLFGWTIVTIFTYAIVNVIDIINWFINGKNVVDEDLIDLMTTIIYTISIIISCDFTSNQGKDFVSTIYSMEEHFGLNSVIRLELLESAELANQYLPNYTVVGFLDIGRKTILTLISTLTTYLIVVIQFNIS